MKITFNAYDYYKDSTFKLSSYEYEGSTESGWKIMREGELYLELGPGYRLLETKLCGICSTDLARHFLPFPLPQVIGHELVASDPASGELFVVEINDTFKARGAEEDIFCRLGLPTHSPARMVLGIDRLPGGFAPYILAPLNAVIPIGRLSPQTAVLIEPFAAALQALTASPPRHGREAAVLGCGRLGLLHIAALQAYRRSSGLSFKIAALARHDNLLEAASKLGADELYDLRSVSIESLKKGFDLVYDTTGSVSGFESALKLSSRELHLKSTNGQECCGLKHLTELVVDELSILPYSDENLGFCWENERLVKSEWVYISPTVEGEKIRGEFKSFKGPFEEALALAKSEQFKERLPRFDSALVSSLEEIDRAIRPCLGSEESLVSPRRAILFKGETKGNPLLEFLAEGGSLKSSRCGDFHRAIKLLEENPETAAALESYLITDNINIERLPEAFEVAKSGQSIKVIMRHKS